MFYLKFWYNVGPKYLFSLEIPRFLTSKIGHVFLALKTMVLNSYEITKDFDECWSWESDTMLAQYFVLSKNHGILTIQTCSGFFWFLKKQNKTKKKQNKTKQTNKKKKKKKKNTVLNLEFWYNVGPNLCTLGTKIPRFWQEKLGHGFLASKTCFLWNTPRFRQVLNLRFRYDVSEISLYSLKIYYRYQGTNSET